MYKKTFVSISFTSTSLQFLQLDPTKHKVLKFGEVKLPQGVIDNYKVADVASLTKLLKSSWKQFGFTEKSVGIVVPEFSTFTKTLNLPQLEIKDLDEAVRWQAQEFLPEGGQQMIMDWKIINSLSQDHQILCVAIPQDILAGFIQAIGDAGLYPLVVETPSLSLVRIAKEENINRLIIYANLGETLLIVAQGEKITGSVVIRSTSQDEILSSALNLVRRYSDNKLEKVFIGGLQITKQLVDNLKANLKLEPSWLTYPVTQINTTQIQQLLIPLSLQLKDPTEPADEHSINLLPPRWVTQYQTQKRKIQTWSLLILSTIIVWSCLFASVGVNLGIQNQLNSFQATLNGSPQTSAQVQKDVIKINSLATKVNKIVDAYPEPAVVVNAISAASLPSVSLQKYIIDFEQGYIKLSGVASDRAALLEFKKKLEENKDFGEINLPLSALLAQTNVVFNLDFTYIPLVPKKAKK